LKRRKTTSARWREPRTIEGGVSMSGERGSAA